MNWNNVGVGQLLVQLVSAVPWIALCVVGMSIGLKHDRMHPTAARRLIAGSALVLLGRVAGIALFMAFLALEDRSRWIGSYSAVSLLVSLTALAGTALIIAAVFAGRTLRDVNGQVTGQVDATRHWPGQQPM